MRKYVVASQFKRDDKALGNKIYVMEIKNTSSLNLLSTGSSMTKSFLIKKSDYIKFLDHRDECSSKGRAQPHLQDFLDTLDEATTNTPQVQM